MAMPLKDYFQIDRFQSLLVDMVEEYGEKLEDLEKYDQIYLVYRLCGDRLRQIDPEAKDLFEARIYSAEAFDSNGVRHRRHLFDLLHDICLTADEAELVQMMRALIDFVQEPGDSATLH